MTPGETSIQWDAPWLDLFDDAFGWTMATILFLLAILMVVGLGMWVAGKLSSSGGAQDNGIKMFGWGLVAAILVGVVGSIIMWTTNLGPSWFNF